MRRKLEPKVAIVDAVQAKHSERIEDNIQELMFGVVRELLDRVGMDRSEIGTVISSSSDYWQGISCSNSYYFDSMGANLKSGSKVAEDSAFAFIYGMMRILSGDYKTALIVSVTKPSECPSVHTLTNLGTDPFFQRPVGPTDLAASAFQARAYVDRYGLTPETMARVVLKNMSNAGRNSKASRGGDLSLEDVLSSPVMASPLRKADVPATSDGACALLLADEDAARQLTDNPVFVQGVGWSTDHAFLGERDLLGGALPEAAKMAYRMAGVEDPSKEIDLAEVCDVTSLHEVLWTELLGFCPAGEGGRLLEEGVTSTGGRLPVNPSGGLFGANPYIARGLVRIAEAAMQVKGQAGGHQAADVRRGLAHSLHGIGAQSHSVVIIGN